MGVTSLRTFLGRRQEKNSEIAWIISSISARIAGVEHAGIGSDIDPSEAPARSIMRSSTNALQTRLSKDISLVLGGNFARAMDQIFRS